MKILALLGVTGVGKSKVAIALAKLLNCDIINFDVYQMYRDFNIGVGKPDKHQLSSVKHHFIDTLEATQQYSIHDFQQQCRDLLKKQNLVIMTGGSNLYLNAVIYDYDLSQDVNEDLYDHLSTEQIYEQLQIADPFSAKNIEKNNRRRVIRALNYFKKNNSSLPRNTYDKNLPLYDVKFIRLNRPLEILKENANRRFEQMIDEGFIEEVKQLKEKYSMNLQPFKAIGYEEISDFLESKISFDEAKEKAKKRLSLYIKRQLTWLNNKFLSNDFDVVDEQKAAQEIFDFLKEQQWI